MGLTREFKQVFKWWWAWNDEQHEKWLNEMSMKGWHLTGIGFSGLIHFFTKGEPRNYYYRIDIKNSRHDIAEYMNLYKDASWEYIGECFGGYKFFCKESNNGEIPEIFNDIETKAAKYKKLLFILLPLFLIIFIVGVANLMVYLFESKDSGNFVIGLVYLMECLFFIWCSYKIIAKIKRIYKDK